VLSLPTARRYSTNSPARRFSHGFTFLAAYTWSKIIGDAPATTVGFPGGTSAGEALQNFNDRHNGRALQDFLRAA
jgi:hypothetical protein